jgi:hypothetical protein
MCKIIYTLLAVAFVFSILGLGFAWNITEHDHQLIQVNGQALHLDDPLTKWGAIMLVTIITSLFLVLVFLVVVPILVIVGVIALLASAMGLLLGLATPIVIMLLMLAVPLLLVGLPLWLVWFLKYKRPTRVVY